MSDKSMGIIVTGDISDIEDKLNNLVEIISNLGDKFINIGVNADTAQLEEIESQAIELDNTDPEIDVTTNADVDQLEEVKTQAIDLDNIDPEIDVNANVDGAITNLNELKDSAIEVANEVEQVGTKSEVAGATARTSFTEAAIALTALTAGLELAAEDIDELNIKFSKMSNSVGSIPEDKMRDLVADISNPNFKADEVLTYITLLKQMGITSADSLRRGAVSLNEMRLATGTTDETIKRFANSLVVMGVNLDDIPSAFNAVAYAQSNIIGGFETYVQWMMKFDSQFAEMGLNIDQTAVIIAAATKKWGGGRAAYQGLNAAIKESNGDLTTLEQKLGMQPGTLSRAEEATAKYTGKVEANTKSVQDHTTTLRKLWDVLDDIKVKYGDVLAMLAGFLALLGAGAGIVGLAVPKILGYFDEIWGTKSLEKYKRGIGKVTGYFRTTFGQIFSTVKDFGIRISQNVRSWTWGDDAAKQANNMRLKIAGEVDNPSILTQVQQFGTDVLNKIRGWSFWGDEAGRMTIEMQGSIEKGFQIKPGLVQRIFQFGDDIINTLSKVFSKLPLEAIGKIGGKLAIVVTMILSALEVFWHGADLFNQNIVTAFLDLLGIDDILKALGLGEEWQGIVTFFNNTLGSIRDFVNFFAGTRIGDMINEFFQHIQDSFQGAIDFSSLEGFGSSVYNYIAAPFMDLMSEGPAQWIQRILGQMIDYLSPFQSAVYDRFSQIGGQIWAAISNVPNIIMSAFNIDWYSLGYNIGAGIGNILNIILEGIYNFIIYLKMLPGQAYNTIMSLGQSVYTAIIGIPGQVQAGVEGIKAKFWNFINYLKTLPGQAYTYIMGLGNQTQAAINTIPAKVQKGTDNITARFLSFINYLKTLPGVAYNWIVSMGQKIYSALVGIPGQVYKALQNIWNQFLSFLGWLASLPSKFYQAAKDAFAGFMKGITDSGAYQWLQKIYCAIVGCSPGIVPALEKMSASGKSNFDSLASSAKNALNMINGLGWDDLKGMGIDLSFTPSSFALPQTTIDAMNASTQQNTNITQEYSIKIEIPSLGDVSREDAQRTGRVIGKEVVDTISAELNQQMKNRGII